MKMKIAFDATTLLDQYSNRGIGTYTKNLLKNLLKNENYEWHLIGFLNKKVNLDLIDKSLNTSHNIYFHSLGSIQSSSVSNLWKSSPKIKNALKQIQPDIYFTPNFERGIYEGNWKNVVMIHDIIPFVSKSYSTKSFIHNQIKGWFYRKQLQNALNADMITTTSHFTKSEIVRYTKVIPDKINPTYLAANENFKNFKFNNNDRYSLSLLDSYNIKGDYILYYGGLEKNKNIDLLVKSFKIVSEKLPKLKLIILSGDFKQKFSGKSIPISKKAKKLVALTKKLGLFTKVDFRGSIDFAHLPLFLAKAKAFVHLSEYEGFGLSVLEAITVGTPTLVSNIPVYNELFKDSVLFTELDNEEQIAKELINLIENKELSKKLSKTGERISSKLLWEETAKQTLKVMVKSKSKSTSKSNSEESSICFVCPFFYPFKGGAENYTLNIAKSLIRKNKKVSVLTSKIESKQLNFEKYRGILINRFNTLINLYYPRFYPGLLFGLLKSNSDIYHVQGFGFIWQDFCLILKKFLSRKKVKFINTPHGPFMARKNYSKPAEILKTLFTKIQRLYLNWLYDTVLMVNPGQAKWISEEYRIDLDKIKYLPIGIESTHFNEIDKSKLDKLKKDLKIRKDTVVLSYLGRFHKYKGVNDILEAINSINKEIDNFKLIMMGSDAGELKNMKKFVIENKLDEIVTIIEKPSNNKRDALLELSNIFIFPSSWEAYGIAMVEAMAHKNAIISSKTEGGLYLIKNRENGLLINHENVQEIRDSISKLIENKDLREKMIATNFNKAKNLTWENIWPEYDEIYTIYE